MESFDLDLDFDNLPQLPSSDDLSPLFLNDEINNIDEDWWQQLALPSPSSSVKQASSPSADAGTAIDDAPFFSYPSHTPTTPSTTEPDVAVALSPSEVAGSKRSAVSSPESDRDDPKRARRLEKNREAASQSRARKKSHMKELEVKCRMLEAHVAQLQRVMSVTSMENSALKDELIRVKNTKDGVKIGVAEPAVLESNSLPSEFLRHLSYHYPMGQCPTSHTAGQFQRFLLVLLQMLMVAAVSGSLGHQTSPSKLRLEGQTYFPVESKPEKGMGMGRNFRNKKSRRRYDSNSRWATRSSEWRILGRKRRNIQRLRSSRIL